MKISSYLRDHQKKLEVKSRRLGEAKKRGDKAYINFLEKQIDKVGKNSLKIETILGKIDKLSDAVLIDKNHDQNFDNKIFKLETKIYELEKNYEGIKCEFEGSSKMYIPKETSVASSRRAKSVKSINSVSLENYNHPLTKPIFRQLNNFRVELNNFKNQQDELNDVFMNSLELIQDKILEKVDERIREKLALRKKNDFLNNENNFSVSSRTGKTDTMEVLSRNLLNQIEEFKKSVNLKISSVMEELRNVVPFDEYEKKCEDFERQIKKFNSNRSLNLEEQNNIPLALRVEDLTIKYKSLKNLVNKLVVDSTTEAFEDKNTNLGSFHSGRFFSTHDGRRQVSEPAQMKHNLKILPEDYIQSQDSFSSKLDKTHVKDIGRKEKRKGSFKKKKKSKSIHKKRKSSSKIGKKKQGTKSTSGPMLPSGRFNRPKIKG